MLTGSGGGRSSERAKRYGVNTSPPFARAAATTAIWRGVTSSMPWPIDIWQVSPGYQRSLKVVFFHSLSGTTPGVSPPRSMPVADPSPNARAVSMTAFVPMAVPRLQKKVLQLFSRAVRSVMGPCPQRSQQWRRRLPSVYTPRQVYSSSGSQPFESAAIAVRGLKVEPGA